MELDPRPELDPSIEPDPLERESVLEPDSLLELEPVEYPCLETALLPEDGLDTDPPEPPRVFPSPSDVDCSVRGGFAASFGLTRV